MFSKSGKSWGLLVSLDVHGCNDRIKDGEAIKQYVTALCDNVIHMKRYGPCHIERFGSGKLEGYSCFQFIETSCVSGHFSDADGSCYIDVFSCAPFDPEDVEAYTVSFFGAKRVRMTITPRLYDDN